LGIEQEICDRLLSLTRDELLIVARKLRISGYRKQNMDCLRQHILEIDSSKVKIAMSITWWDRNCKLIAWISLISAIVTIIGFVLAFLSPGVSQKDFERTMQPVSQDVIQIRDRLNANPEILATTFKKFIREKACEQILKEKLDGLGIARLERQRDYLLQTVDNLIEMLKNGLFEDASPIFVSAMNILSNPDPQTGGLTHALSYLKASRDRILKDAKRYENEETNARERKQNALRPILMEALLHKQSFEWDEAVEDLRLVVQIAPNWWECQTQLGLLLMNRALWKESELHLRSALNMTSDDILKVFSLRNLSGLYDAQGMYLEAEKLSREALAMSESKLGKEHLQTLESMHDLGITLIHQEKYVDSQPLLEGAWKARDRLLGPKHPDTLTSLNSLVVLLIQTGDLNRAELLLEQSFKDSASEKIIIPTPLFANTISVLLSKKGDYAQALPLAENALKINQQQHGEEHPVTLTCLNNLAWLYQQSGDHLKAQPLFERVLELRERLLGKNHPETIICLRNLAFLLYKSKNYIKAQSCYEKILKFYEMKYGKDNAVTLTSLRDLAVVLCDQGDYQKAQPLYERILEVRERILGKEHPDTLVSLEDLAGVLCCQNEYLRAQALYERALEASERTKGRDHPDSLRILNHLARVISLKGEYVVAQPLCERVADARERVLGKEHPDTLMSLENLAALLCCRKEYVRAQPLYERTLVASERTKGRDHPDTLHIVDNLARLHYQHGDYVKAQSYYERLLHDALMCSKRTQQPHHKLMETSGCFVQCMIVQGRSTNECLKVLGDISRPYGIDLKLQDGDFSK